MTLEPVRDEEAKRVTLVRVALDLPHGFPEKYRPAIERAIDHCAVKKLLMDPPSFEIAVNRDGVVALYGLSR